MKRTKGKSKGQKIIEKMKREIKAYHNHLTDAFIESLSISALLSWCHPIYRDEYKRHLEECNLLID